MNLIQAAVRYPVSTAVGVILIVMFGVISLLRLPVQLTPSVEDPIINVTTVWPGASPLEVEREIIQEQEDQLKSLEGMVEMKSESMDSTGIVRLKFQIGTDMNRALLLASNRLEQVPSYPDDVEKPVLTTADADSNAFAWFVIAPYGDSPYDGDVAQLFDFVDDEIRPEFERVPGVASSNFFGGRAREVQVLVDPAALAARQVTIREVADALAAENSNVSGGDFDEGKRRYIVRTVGEYDSTEEIEDVVVAIKNDVPVYLRDVGHAQLGFRKASARVYNKGRPIIAINAGMEPGRNIFEVMDGVKEAADALNRGRLGELGLRLEQVYDETEYITSAIDLVQQSLIIGGILAVVMLLLYLRSGSSTLVIAVAIPVSVIGAFILMLAFGRSLNVISLAGMAFAVGMVVDNSIVVLENIYRYRQRGLSRFDAAVRGAREVWGAVLASTVTTIAVFLPVVFMQDEVGQLFGDIALAISCAVALSLVVSITVIPALSAKVLGSKATATGQGKRRSLGALDRFGAGTVDAVASANHRIAGSWLARIGLVVVLTGVSVGLTAWLLPERDYLPLGNQNFVFGFMLPPPGYSLEEVASMEQVLREDLEHLWQGEPGSDGAESLAGGGIDNFFFVALPSQAFMGARARDSLRVKELIPIFQGAAAKIPGAIFVMSQRSLFERGIGEGRNIDVDISGPDLDRLIALGGQIFGGVMAQFPDAQARPIPSLDLGNPEVRVTADRRRIAELNLSSSDLGFAVDTLVDGAKVSDYQDRGKEIDLRLMIDEDDPRYRTHLLEQLPIAAPSGQLVTLGTVARVDRVNGPVQINRVERRRAITIQLTPSEEMALQEAMTLLDREVLEPMRASGQLDGSYRVSLAGSAQKLTDTLRSIRWNLLLALVITYLLLAALFESFVYPFVILFSVPLAGFGGVLGLALTDLAVDGGQKLDVLTMLGFIILIGTVVNNAILIVHQSLNLVRSGELAAREAIREAVRQRMRPIFMSVSTSVCGMMPLVAFPGAGSELYRGLGSVVVGGLLLSTVFTLFLVPALLSLSLELGEVIGSRLRGRRAAEATN